MKKLLYLSLLGCVCAGSAVADTCSGTIPLPEGLPEAAFTCTLPAGFTFGANAGVAVMLDHGSALLVSDVITLADVPGGLSTVTFVSDPDLPLGLPAVVNFTVTEPHDFLTFATSVNGSVLNLTFDSDNNENGRQSDFLSVSAPEPATLALLCTGLIFAFIAFNKPRKLA
jgi:hypothetical protein